MTDTIMNGDTHTTIAAPSMTCETEEQTYVLLLELVTRLAEDYGKACESGDHETQSEVLANRLASYGEYLALSLVGSPEYGYKEEVHAEHLLRELTALMGEPVPAPFQYSAFDIVFYGSICFMRDALRLITQMSAEEDDLELEGRKTHMLCLTWAPCLVYPEPLRRA